MAPIALLLTVVIFVLALALSQPQLGCSEPSQISDRDNAAATAAINDASNNAAAAKSVSSNDNSVEVPAVDSGISSSSEASSNWSDKVWAFIQDTVLPFLQYWAIPIYFGWNGLYYKVAMVSLYNFRVKVCSVLESVLKLGDGSLLNTAQANWDRILPWLPTVFSGIVGWSVLWFCYIYLTSPKELEFSTEEIVSMAKSFSGSSDSSAPLLGHVAVVTGSTSGIGEEIAAVLYQIGATVVVPARDTTKGERIIKEFKQRFPNSKGSLATIKLDTEDLLSVNSFVSEFTKKFGELSILVNNAGIHYMSYGMNALRDQSFNSAFRSPQGFDKAFATNYLGHFHLTRQLLDLLQSTSAKKKTQSRVVNVSSCYSFQSDGTMLLAPKCGTNDDYCWTPEAARSGVNTFDHRQNAYCNNKLAQILHAKELTSRIQSGAVKAPNVAILSVCPGWVSTNLLPDSFMGNFIRSCGFPVSLGICSAMHGILNTSKYESGQFILNSKSPLFGKSLNALILKTLTVLDIRNRAIDFLAMYLLATQGST